MNFLAVPKPGQKPLEPVVPEPPRSHARRLGAFPWLVLGGAVGAMGLLGATLLLLDTKPNERSETAPAARARGADPSETPGEIARPESVASPEPASKLEPSDVVPVAATSDARAQEPLAEWPPARAFTARCKAPGGGCVSECTTLAGGRCLDPCFIHTAGCSNDCRKPDGTCGWPPPDSE